MAEDERGAAEGTKSLGESVFVGGFFLVELCDVLAYGDVATFYRFRDFFIESFELVGGENDLSERLYVGYRFARGADEGQGGYVQLGAAEENYDGSVGIISQDGFQLVNVTAILLNGTVEFVFPIADVLYKFICALVAHYGAAVIFRFDNEYPVGRGYDVVYLKTAVLEFEHKIVIQLVFALA